MEHQFLCKKWHSSNDPYELVPTDYSEVVDMTEPDQCYTLPEILQFSIANTNPGIRMYDEYDDSEEGAEYEYGRDQFEYRQELLDLSMKPRKKKETDPPKEKETDPPKEKEIDPPIDPE